MTLSISLTGQQNLFYCKKKRKWSFLNLKKISFDGIVKLKLHRERLYSAYSVKYLGIKIGENLNWKHKNDISV